MIGSRLACLALAALVACSSSGGGGSAPTSAARGLGSTTTSAAAGGNSEATSGEGANERGTAGLAGTATTEAAAPTTTKGPNVELERSCAVRGSATRRQGFTASVGAGNIVIYSTSYSDGSNELTEPRYKTGFGNTTAGPAGKAVATWVVPASAPTGTATLHVSGSVEVRPRTLTFKVAPTDSGCP